MRIDSLNYRDRWSINAQDIDSPECAQLVLLFGNAGHVPPDNALTDLRQLYPNATVIGSSTGGNIQHEEISDAAYIATAVQFEHGWVESRHLDFDASGDFEDIGAELLESLPKEDLRHVFLLSDGLNVNGSALVRGLRKTILPCSITGAMAGDGDRFTQTWVAHNTDARDWRVAAVGFYGINLEVSSSTFSGWTEFGADRVITRSKDKVLFELDHQPALDLYKKYLGVYAEGLPLSGKRFPLNVRAPDQTHEVIRTPTAIDEEAKTISFAGDVPEGYIARLMQPKVQDLIEGAVSAANAIEHFNDRPALGLVVSCTGRRIVMGDLIEEEIADLSSTLGDNVVLTGLYSYGEIAPYAGAAKTCELHNQTVSLTAIFEQ